MKSLFIITTIIPLSGRFPIPIPDAYKIPVFIGLGVVLLIISLNYEKIKKWFTHGKQNAGKTTNNNMPPEDDKKDNV
jgi:hypothetical protein